MISSSTHLEQNGSVTASKAATHKIFLYFFTADPLLGAINSWKEDGDAQLIFAAWRNLSQLPVATQQWRKNGQYLPHPPSTLDMHSVKNLGCIFNPIKCLQTFPCSYSNECMNLGRCYRFPCRSIRAHSMWKWKTMPPSKSLEDPKLQILWLCNRELSLPFGPHGTISLRTDSNQAVLWYLDYKHPLSYLPSSFPISYLHWMNWLKHDRILDIDFQGLYEPRDSSDCDPSIQPCHINSL